MEGQPAWQFHPGGATAKFYRPYDAQFWDSMDRFVVGMQS